MLRLNKIRLIRNVVLSGFLFSYVYNYVFNGLILHKGYPFNTFFPAPAWDFADFLFHTFLTRNMSPYLDTGISLKSNFPPFMHILVWPATLPAPVTALLIFSGLFALFCSWAGWRHLQGESVSETVINVLGIVFCSYPFLFSLFRGNYEIYVFILAYFSVITFPKWRSAVFIGLAAACKIFPAVLALLFLDRKNYAKAILSALVAGVLTTAAFCVLDGGVAANIAGFRHMMQVYQQHYVLNTSGLSFNHSLYGVLLAVAGTGSGWLSQLYFKVAMVIGIIVVFLVTREALLWKKLTLLVVMMTLLPYVSGDYKLLHFFLPLFLFVEASPARSDRIYCWLFGLIMIPKAWFFFGRGDMSCSVVINPLLIFVLLVVIAKELLAEVKKRLLSGKVA